MKNCSNFGRPLLKKVIQLTKVYIVKKILILFFKTYESNEINKNMNNGLAKYIFSIGHVFFLGFGSSPSQKLMLFFRNLIDVKIKCYRSL